MGITNGNAITGTKLKGADVKKAVILPRPEKTNVAIEVSGYMYAALAGHGPR